MISAIAWLLDLLGRAAIASQYPLPRDARVEDVRRGFGGGIIIEWSAP